MDRSYKIGYQEIIQSVWSDAQNKMEGYLAPLSWTEAELRRHQTKALREILTIAKEKTGFYKKALQSIDTENFNLEDLSSITPTSKEEHMKNWDDFVTDPALTYNGAEKHLEGLRHGDIENPFYNDRYLLIATGGSSGLRGLFVWDKDFLSDQICLTYRLLMDQLQRTGYSGSMRMATVEAPTLLHGSRFLFSSKPHTDMDLLSMGSTESLESQCERLNQFQPDFLTAFASSAAELASAQLRGELEISPKWVSTNSSTLDDVMRERIKEAWGVKACNTWGCVEIGMAAVESAGTPGLVICEDAVILELVDESDMPVKHGEQPARVLGTSLLNRSCPMIRYEVDDVLEIGEGFNEYPTYRRITAIPGRAMNWFHYGSVRVHPMAFSDVLDLAKEIEEYQVVQTERGGVVRLVCNGEPDQEEIIGAIKKELIKDGLKDPEVKVEIIDSLPRHPETGKVKRFVALS